MHEDAASFVPTPAEYKGRVYVLRDRGEVECIDPATGKTLWHLNMGGPLLASPMTYMLDGRQYLMIPIYDTLYAFSLPERPAKTN